MDNDVGSIPQIEESTASNVTENNNENKELKEEKNEEIIKINEKGQNQENNQIEIKLEEHKEKEKEPENEGENSKIPVVNLNEINKDKKENEDEKEEIKIAIELKEDAKEENVNNKNEIDINNNELEINQKDNNLKEQEKKENQLDENIVNVENVQNVENINEIQVNQENKNDVELNKNNVEINQDEKEEQNQIIEVEVLPTDNESNINNKKNVLVENENLTNEEMCQRNNVNDNTKELNNEKNDNIINKEQEDNTLININIEGKEEIKTDNNEKNIEGGFNTKDIEKITEYNKNNYKDFYLKNHFCDYFTGKEWRSGFITNISDGFIELFDSTGLSNANTNLGVLKIKADDSKKIAYFRKYSVPDNNMVKGASKNIKNKLSQFINFHNNFKEYLENCNSFEFFYFLRATVFYGLDFCMNTNLENKIIDTSFQLILVILNIICDCLKFIEENFEDFLKYQNDIKQTQFKDLVLINKTYAIYSFFDDISILMKKIFGDCSDYLDWYIKYKSDIYYFIPTLTCLQKGSLYSDLFPLYEDQPKGDKPFKLLKKSCIKEAYIKDNIYFTLDKKISSCIIAYFIDYFKYLNGYDILFTLLCSIQYNSENYFNNFSIQYQIIDMLLTAKTLTGSFNYYNEEKNIEKNDITNKELKGREKVIHYIDEFLNNANADIDEKNKNAFNNEIFKKLEEKLIMLINKDEEDAIILKDLFHIQSIFKQLKNVKKLEKSIANLNTLNNIIKSVEYNTIYYEIKEKNNKKYTEEMLKDQKFIGKDKDINKMTELYFCELCKDNNIIELYLENKTAHEEIIKRIFPLLSIMYKNNFGYKGDSKNTNDKKIDAKYIFDSLFVRLEESEKNNESLWKIIMSDIILKFADVLKSEDKIYIFSLINKYYESTSTKKSSKILHLVSFITDYSSKCMNSGQAKENIPDLLNYKDLDLKNNINFDLIGKGQLNHEKYYCLELLINFLIEKDKINELQIDDEMKKTVITKCSDGIITIIDKDKNNENIKLILFIKIVQSIISEINPLFNISLLKRIIEKCSNDELKNQIKIYCETKIITSNLVKEFYTFLNTIKKDAKETKENKDEIDERFSLLFLLIENNIQITLADYKILLNAQIYPSFVEKIIYSKIKENISKINIKLQQEILDKILLKDDAQNGFNNSLRYGLIKEFILQINKSLGVFTFIYDVNGDNKDKYLIVKIKKSFDDIYGYQSLWNILLNSEKKEIKNEVSKFLVNIFLGMRFDYQPYKFYSKFCTDIFQKILELFKKYKDLKNLSNINKLKGLVCLFKNIVEESNFDGEIITKSISDAILKSLKPKDNNGIKDDKSPTNIIKNINLEYAESVNDGTVIKTNNCEIHPNEYFYQLRYYISYTFQIPIRRIQIKKYEPSEKIQPINIYNDLINMYDIVNDKKKKKKGEIDLFRVESIKNPFSDDSKDNIRKLILNNTEILEIMRELLRNKNVDFANDIIGLMRGKIEINDSFNKEGLKIINNIVMNNNKDNTGLLNELFNFNQSNLIQMNFTLANISSFLESNKSKEDIINKFIKSPLWSQKIKDLGVESNDENIKERKTPSLNELLEKRNYDNNLLNIYKRSLSAISFNNQDLEVITKNVIKIINNIIDDCIYINFITKNDEEKKTLDNLKKLYINFFKDIKQLFTKNKNLHKSFIKIFIKEKEAKEKFEYFFLDGIIRNNYPLFSEQIGDLFITIIQQKNDEIKDIKKDFYNNVSQIFFTEENRDKITKMLFSLYKSPNMLILSNMNKYEYNLDIYFNTISQVFDNVYKYVADRFNFDNYIQTIVIPSLFKPFLDNIDHESNFHDHFLGGQCKIFYQYLDNVSENEFKNIEYYKGKSIKEYLYDEFIMYNHETEENENPLYKPKERTSSSHLKVTYSFNSIVQLFIAFLIKEEYFYSTEKDEQGGIIPRKNIMYYLNELNNLNLTHKPEGNQASDWKIYFKEKAISNTFIGLKNLGCTCYMNSLLQVFYNISLFRESLLKCKCKAENNNSLYEVQKIFFNLKYMKNGYYTPESIVNNYDNEKLNPHIQMDVDEFFSNLLDKLENRIKNTDNENLIKYFFQGKLNDTLSFQEGCNHDRTNVTNFYSIQLQVMNKKNIYESLDTLTEGELMNGDNCIFCPECNKKFPALKSQSFNQLPRILMFVLKRFEFNYDTMAKIKINDYYEFPTDLDMSKYIQNKENNKYKLKSVVVHMGHSEGGHYYAYIKEEKSQSWYQFNDTSVTKFDIMNLKEETYGGKELTGEEKNRSAYLLFYEKVDQTNCEQFDKNKILNKLINLKNKKTNNNNNTKTKEDNNDFNLIEENKENDEKNEIKEEEDDDLIDMGGSGEDNKKKFTNINEQMKAEYLKQLIYSSNYQLFTLSLFLNIINSLDNKGNNLPEAIKNINFIPFSNPFEGEANLFRTEKPLISNIKKLTDKGKIKLLKIENKKYSKEELAVKMVEVFKYILYEFFYIIIHSREKKYFGCFVELIKYLINLYDFCAEYFLEEFSCYNTIIDYLINCPMYDIKKILVGLIHSAMQKSEQSYKDKRGNNNVKVKNETKVKEEPKLSDEELAKKLQEELNGVSKSKEADETILYKDISSPYVLKVIYNIIYIVFRKIKFYSYKNETRFLLDILHKFSLISQENRKFLVNEINISLPLNLFIGKKCQEKEYSEQEVLNIDKGLFKPAHEILNPTPGQTVLGDRDKTGNYATLDYDIMLLCSLNYFKARTKDEIKKRNEDIGFSFYSDRYILSLIRHCKTKQGIKYFYKLVLLKCLENKEIFETVVKRLIAIIDAISDTEAAFFDESDLESDAEIYKNVGENAGDDCSLKTLKKNVSFVFRKLVSDSKNDKLRDYKIKTILSKLFTYFSKNKKYYSKAITIVNILLNIFETSEIDIKKYSKELNEILNWLIKYPVPPKHYEIRGMNMYKDQPPVYHYKEMSKEQKAQFEKKEKDITNKKVERLKKIMSNKKIDYNIANFDWDLSDFKFNFGDVVLYENKEYVVTNCLDEMIKVKLIEKKSNNEWDEINRSSKINKKKKSIYDREKISFWIDTDNYKLKVKKLVANNESK